MEILKLVVFISIQWFIHCNKGADVSLTVEGGTGLNGPVCPGAIRLLCNGVDLTQLRWQFNDFPVIHSFLEIRDGVTDVVMLNGNPAFILAELVSVHQHSTERRANLSSILTVDALQLHEQKGIITNISCGDITTVAFEQVCVDIIQEAPESPNITKIISVYESTTLTQVEVEWTAWIPACPGYWSALSYTVNFDGAGYIQINQTQCNAVSCKVMIQVEDQESDLNGLSIVISNDTTLLGNVTYPTVIKASSSSYFWLNFSSDIHNCNTTATCNSITLPKKSVCNVSYSINDSLGAMETYMELNMVINRQYKLTIPAGHHNYKVVVKIDELFYMITQGSIIIDIPPPITIHKIKTMYTNRGYLKEIFILWDKYCESIDYTIIVKTVDNETIIAGVDVSSITHCFDEECSIIILFSEIILLVPNKPLKISIRANKDTQAVTTEFNHEIDVRSDTYYHPSFDLFNCTSLQVNCYLSHQFTIHKTSCRVSYYGGDSLHMNLKAVSNISVNTAIGTTMTLEDSTTVHYFTFSLHLDNIKLQIEQSHVYLTGLICVPQDRVQEKDKAGFTTETIIGIVTGCLGLLVILLAFSLLCFSVVALCKRYRKLMKSPENPLTIERPIEQSSSARPSSPEYEEIRDTNIWGDIQLNVNEAYSTPLSYKK